MRIFGFLTLVTALAAPLSAGVVINEFQSAPNEILVDYDATTGMPRIGYGPSWWENAFYDTPWLSGTAPIGHSTTGLGKDLGTAMDDKTPSLYVRKTFNLHPTEAAQTTDLILRVWYNDGFVAILNGKEVTRANLGPAKQVTYRDQVPYRATTEPMPAEYNLGPANNWLIPGDNVLAIQVHNRDLGGNCSIDASLSSNSPAVYTTLSSFDFTGANGAFLTHQRNGATVTNTLTGSPPGGSWLALAPNPQSDAAWPGLTMATTLAPAGGVGNSEALVYSISQSSAGSLPAAFFGPEVNAAPQVTAGAMSAFDLSRIDLTFRYKVSTGASFGFRLDPTPGASAQALTGFPAISAAAGIAEDAPKEFADNSGGMRTRTVGATGSSSDSSSGIVRHSPVLGHGPALRNAAFRYSENNTAGEGYNGTTGALKLEIIDPPNSPAENDYVQFSRSGHTVRGWTAGAVTAADLARVNFTFAFRAPVGTAWQVFLEPDNATSTYADRADFGTITGTGAWQLFDQPFSAATNTGAMLTKLNALGTTAFRVTFRGDAMTPVGQALWVDAIGFSSAWRSYTINLASAGTASQTAFLNAMNGASRTAFTPAFTKSSSAISPAADTLSIDEFLITYRTVGGPQAFVPQAASWKYFIGRHEPSGGFADPAEFADPLYDGDMRDWVELHNDGTEAVNLTGWSLTDDADLPQQWTFPAGTTIAPGGYLIVMCDGRTTPLAGAQYLHTNFELSTDGEHFSLRDPSGAIVSDASSYSKQNAFHTWGRNPSGPEYGYLRHGTPGRANSGPFFPLRAKTPDFSLPGGFYSGPQSITIASETPGAVIRYTTDGTEPTTFSLLYTGAITLNPLTASTGHCLRARAWITGGIPSETKTATYLINQDARLQSAPALIFTGDPGKSMFTPYGITAIGGGTRDANGVWSATTVSDYNNVLGDLNNALTGGQAWERPFNIEWRYADGRDGFNEPCGIRVSGSGHARPRFVLNNIQNAPWSYTSYLEKPSFNVFFRNEYGTSGVSQKLFPGGYPVEYFEQLRVRAGKNDVSNPFVKDEFMRRLYINMGQQGSRGVINTLYVNGKFRGTYNMTERLREPFMQQHFNSTAEWDVRQVTEIANGDATAFTSFISLLDTYNADPGNQTKYNAAVAQLDVTAYIDYALVNIWGGTGDWPHNNFVASRERSATGKWRWFVWDAEGAFGGFSKHLGYNVITQDLLTNVTASGREICRTYDRLSKNAEFRLQFADRIHRHFCNGGALSDARLTALKNEVVAEYQPLYSYMFPTGTLSTSWFTSWVSAAAMDKRDVLFRTAVFDDPTTTGTVDPKEFGYQFSKANVWPAVEGQGTWNAPLPPKFSQHGGDVPGGYQLSIYHTEMDNDITKDAPYKTAASQFPSGRVIYYTTDGSDPRVTGGTVNASALTWTAPVSLPGSYVVIKSRIRDTVNGEWSPLTEATFRVGAVSPSAANLVIAELMYNPQGPTAAEPGITDGDAFEFIRLLNAGSAPVKLSEARFVTGIAFDFASGAVPVLDPGQSAFVVSSSAAFRTRYGTAYISLIAGEFTGTNLSNGGERLRLETQSAATIQDFIYDDAPPWPAVADGSGPSLVLINPASLPDHNNAANWTASARPGGLLTAPLTSLGYDRWRSLFWNATGAASNDSGMTADSDGDGLTNFAEYASGTNPHAADGPLLRTFMDTVAGTPVLCIEFRTQMNASDVLTIPQYSTDMNTWATAATLSPPVTNPDGTLTHRCYAPASAGPRVLMRVRFVQD